MQQEWEAARAQMQQEFEATAMADGPAPAPPVMEAACRAQRMVLESCNVTMS